MNEVHAGRKRPFPFRTLVSLLVACVLHAAASDEVSSVTACDTGSLAPWAVSPDGGDGLSFSLNTKDPRSSKPALVLSYRRGGTGWGNLVTTVTVPADAIGIRLGVRVRTAAPKAAFYVWLFEKDGDAYVTAVQPKGRSLERAGTSWHDVFLPFTAFAFTARGDTKRAFLSIDRLLLGISHDSADIEIDGIEFVLVSRIERAEPGRTPSDIARPYIAILDDEDLPRRGAPASAERLRALLTTAGFHVEVLGALELAGRSLPAADLLVLPTGPAFPAIARENVTAFLKGGGSLLTMGGYAFDEPVIPIGKGTFGRCLGVRRAGELDRQPGLTGINTRAGRPGDTLRLKPDQIGMFDPSDRFEDAIAIRTEGVTCSGSFSGWSAVGLIGSNNPVFPRVHARWQAILHAEDRYGRRIAPAAAVLSHFAGPFRGGRWAFFGVDNVDLFSEGMLPEAYVVRLARTLAARCFMWELLPTYYCYRRGETVEVSVKVGNFGRHPQKVRLLLHAPSTKPHERLLTLQPGEIKIERASFPASNRFGLYEVRAHLALPSPSDHLLEEDLVTGYCVWEPEAGVNGPELSFKENYFRINGAPRFLTGTNQTGVVWFSTHEEPHLWARDVARLRDHALNVVRYLHFSPFAAGDPLGRDRNNPLHLATEPPKALVRKTDALIYLLATHDQIPFLALHDWQSVVLTDKELEAQRTWARYWARRYKGVKGMLYDIQNEPTVRLRATATTRELWNRFVATLPPAVAAAFRQPDELFTASDLAWNDPRGTLRERFKIWLFRRWTGANAAGVWEADPGALITVGLLPSNPPIDKALGPKGLSFSCFHFYGKLSDFAVAAMWADRRLAGQGLTVGEFGAQEAHNARTRGETGAFAAESVNRYMYTNLVTFGLGGAMACSWDMREMPETVFPWGMAHRDGRPKMVLRAYRALSLLLRPVRPRPPEPGIVMLLPDGNRIGSGKARIDQAIADTIRVFLHLNVPFSLATEEDILAGNVTKAVRLWPLPHVSTAEAAETVYRELNEGAARMFGPLTDTMRRAVPTEAGRAVVVANPRSTLQAITLDNGISFELPPLSASLVHTGSDNAVLGLVGQGIVRSDKRLLAELPNPTVLWSLPDERRSAPTGLLDADVLVASPLAPGRLCLATERFSHYAVGEIVAGRFNVHERGKLQRAADRPAVVLPIDRQRQGCLILLGTSQSLEAAGARLAEWTKLTVK